MERSRSFKILGLALPIIGGMVSQNILNLVDTAMVGSLGDVELAAVGYGSFAVFMAQAFIMGLSSGVQALSARRMGEGREAIMAQPLNGGLFLALSMALPISVALFLLAPEVFGLLTSDARVVEAGTPYFQARVCAVAAVGCNFAFRGYWNGVNLSRLYMQTLILMHVCNIALNYVLIFGALGFPELGATGAGIGTAVSTGIGTLAYLVLGFRHAHDKGFLQGLPTRGALARLLRLSLPTSFQQLFFAAGFTVLFWIIGQVGTAEVAAANVLVQLLLVMILPAMALGITAASLVSQALGRGDPEDAARWAWDVVKVSAVVLTLLGLPMVLIPDVILSGFLRAPSTVELATGPLRLSGATILVDAVGMVLMNALLGAGDTRRVMVVSIATQWLLFLPAAYLLGPGLGFGLMAIWIAQVGQRFLQSCAFALLWSRGAWKSIAL